MDVSDIDCVVPAAGLSSRMPGHKLLTLFGGRPLLHWALENAAAACKRVIVVVGHNESGIREALPRTERHVIVTNQHYSLGMLTSIAAGASAVESDLFFVAPADMPFLSAELYRTVEATARAASRPGGPDLAHREADGANAEGSVAWFPEYRGRRGHPVLVSATVIPALLGSMSEAVANQSQAGSMRDLLAEYATVTVPVGTDGTLVDIDTPEDLERYSGRAGRQHP